MSRAGNFVLFPGQRQRDSGAVTVHPTPGHHDVSRETQWPARIHPVAVAPRTKIRAVRASESRRSGSPQCMFHVKHRATFANARPGQHAHQPCRYRLDVEAVPRTRARGMSMQRSDLPAHHAALSERSASQQRIPSHSPAHHDGIARRTLRLTEAPCGSPNRGRPAPLPAPACSAGRNMARGTRLDCPSIIDVGSHAALGPPQQALWAHKRRRDSGRLPEFHASRTKAPAGAQTPFRLG